MKGWDHNLRQTIKLLLILFVFFCPRGRAGQDHGPLQQRIDLALPGDTLHILPGMYNGNVHISKRLILIGTGRPVLHGSGHGSVMTITADSCVISGLVVEHSGTMLVEEDAGILVKSSYNTIRNNELRDILFGVYYFHAQSNLTAGNTITGRKYLEVGERGSGIHIWNSRDNTYIGNTITDARDGFYIQNANGMLIQGNEVSGVRYGLHYMYADSNTFLDNRFHDNIAGAAIMYSRSILMRRNSFTHNRSFSSFGILFQDCHNSLADSNIIAENVIGLFLEASTDNLFLHNIVARNDAALEMYQNSEHNIFTENNFIDNLTPLLLAGKRTGTEWSYRGKGNYWSSYDGYDLDGNGIGDIPMKIQNVFQYLEGRNPNLRLYLYSPASQALAAATNAFPVAEINTEVDGYPLIQPVALSLYSLTADRTNAERDSRPPQPASFMWLAMLLAGTGMCTIVLILNHRRILL